MPLTHGALLYVARVISLVTTLASHQPTQKSVCRFCLVYELAHGKITRARLYFETDSLRQQAGPDWIFNIVSIKLIRGCRFAMNSISIPKIP